MFQRNRMLEMLENKQPESSFSRRGRLQAASVRSCRLARSRRGLSDGRLIAFASLGEFERRVGPGWARNGHSPC
jgi:hypothetical protein